MGQPRKKSQRTAAAPNGKHLSANSRSQWAQATVSNGVSRFPDWGSLVAVKIIQIAETISRSASQVYEAGYGVRNSELRILLLLGVGERLSVNEISRRAGIDKAWISRSLNIMMKQNMVKRIPHPFDSRKSLLSLTEKGEQSLRTITPIALARDRQILSGLDKKEIHRVLDTLHARARQLLLPEPSERPPSRRTRPKKERVAHAPKQ